jgi:hypothetical protein
MRSAPISAAVYLGAVALAMSMAAPARVVGAVVPPVPSKPAAGPPSVSQPSPQKSTSTCLQDDPVPTPRGWRGWDRSAVIAWQTVEQAGGIVPEIEEDRAHAPPAWWRYPSALRSLTLLDAETKNAALGLYRAIAPSDLAKGDILVRTRGADVGVCGKMAVLGGQVGDQWITIEVDPENQGPSTRPASPLFFAADGETLLPDTRAFRIRVRNEETIGHIRELRRDLDHLERTVGHHPPLLAAGDEAREAVAQKVHDLIDEAWSLVAEESYDVDRRELAGRALVLGAQLDWPGADVGARAVLDDVLKKSPGRATALAAQAGLALHAGATKNSTHASATGVRYFATADEIGIESKDLGFQIRWPLTWRVLGLSSNAETGVLANLITGRILLPDGHTDRGAAVILAQRPPTPAARATLVRDGARKMFPTAKMKALTAFGSGTRQQEFREKHEGAPRTAAVTTIDRNGVVTFLVLNAPGDVYSKLHDEYVTFVRSMITPAASPTGAPTALPGSTPVRAPSADAGVAPSAGAGGHGER